MSDNSIAPGFVVLHYVTGTRPHKQTLPVSFSAPPTAGIDPMLTIKSGPAISFSTAIAAWVDLIKPLFNAEVSFNNAEIWYKPLPESDPLFIFAAALGVAGTGVAATSIYSQLTTTFRCANGSLLKIQLMEVIQGLPSRDAFPFANATVDAISDFLTSNSTWIFSRGNSVAIAPMFSTLKNNDALRKKYLLAT